MSELVNLVVMYFAVFLDDIISEKFNKKRIIITSSQPTNYLIYCPRIRLIVVLRSVVVVRICALIYFTTDLHTSMDNN